jgi:hypothetical protein
MTGRLIHIQLGRKWKKAVVAYFKVGYPGICLKGLKITTKNFSQDSRSACRNLNPGLSGFETGVVSTRP